MAQQLSFVAPPRPPQPAPTLKPPQNVPKPTPQGAILGVDVETRAPLAIPPKTRERHLYLIGKSGTGKTTLIKNLIVSDMNAGHGVGFIDPHGDASFELLANVPPHRVKDVIYFDPTSEYAPAFNPLLLPYEANKLTEDILSSLKMFFGDSWGPRLEHLLRYGILTLLTHGIPHTLKDLQTLFLRSEWRDQMTSRHPNAAIRDFWQLEFPGYGNAASQPILNKLSPLLMPGSPMQRVFSQRTNALNFSAILNQKKILIVNLSKGKLGEEPSRLLGGLITAGIQQAALARAAIAEGERKDFYFYVDEFQNYTVSSFNSILAEARKYRLFLALAHQNLGQLPNDLERNIFGNVATLVAFGVSADDARALQKEMHRSQLTFRPNTESKFRSSKEELAQLIRRTKEEYVKKHAEVQKKVAEIDAKLDPEYTRRNYEAFMKEAAWRKFANPRPLYMDSLEQFSEYVRGNLEELKRPLLSELEFYRLKVEILSNPVDSPQWLSIEFPEYTFKDATFPAVDDFINLPPHHAFARIERAENVTAFKTNPPPPPIAGIRGQILHAMRAPFEEQARKAKLAAEAQARARKQAELEAARRQQIERARAAAKPRVPQPAAAPGRPVPHVEVRGDVPIPADVPKRKKKPATKKSTSKKRKADHVKF